MIKKVEKINEKVKFSDREVENSARRGVFQAAGVCSRSPGLSGGNQVDD